MEKIVIRSFEDFEKYVGTEMRVSGSVNRTVSTGFFGVTAEPNAEKVKPFHTA